MTNREAKEWFKAAQIDYSRGVEKGVIANDVCNTAIKALEENDKLKAELDTVIKKNAAIIMRSECEYRYPDPYGWYWCKSTGGMSGHLIDKSGCSNGKRREQDE